MLISCYLFFSDAGFLPFLRQPSKLPGVESTVVGDHPLAIFKSICYSPRQE